MSRLIFTVPIQLARNEDGFWLQIKTLDGQEATINLDSIVNGPIAQGIWQKWARDTMSIAQLKSRRSTGLSDADSRLIYEGDLVRLRHSTEYPEAVAVVTWKPEIGAFTFQGTLDNGSHWETPNLQSARTGSVIGNVFENAELLVPAVAAVKAAA